MLNKKSSIGSIIVCIIFSYSVYAQEQSPKPNKVAENIFSNFLKLGVTHGNATLYTKNVPNAVDYRLQNRIGSYWGVE